MRRRFSILIWFTSEGVMLKRIIWILCLLGLTGSCELFAHDGTVNISGSFRRNTCVLAQDSKQINVQLGNVSLTRFSHGNYGPEKSFIINLQDCGTDVSTVDVTFSGTPDGTQSEMLSIESGTDAASGLAIAILDDAKILIPLNQASKDYSLHSSKVPLTFYAQLRPVNSDVQSGKVNASATFVLHYD
ncbi:Fimbrial protein [Escherichia coli]|uniref:Fimbrial protein n=1 Tax=Escherichia coli TaxID=562 RepID=A0A376M9Q3_ECOLX|nr:Fimbrial protein [Escherichia coli]